MLAREYCDKNKSMKKPIIVSHHMLAGMTKPKDEETKVEENDDEDTIALKKAIKNKMSKSDPNSAIFMEDDEDKVILKVKKAYCEPMVDIDDNENKNPILDYCENIIFPAQGKFFVERSEKNGGSKLYENY